jgi:non-homologous end joining protein Ku
MLTVEMIESKVKGRMIVAEPKKVKEEESRDLVAALKSSIQNITKANS